MTPDQLARILDRKAELLREGLIRAERASQADALSEAQHLSTGSLSYAELERLDHPYATRHGGARVPGDPAIINTHRGTFYRAWQASPTFVSPSGVTHFVVNNSDVAGYLQHGTKKMIARPLPERVIERIHYSRLARIEGAIRKALK